MDAITETLKELEAAMDGEADKLEKMAQTGSVLRARILDRNWPRLEDEVGKMRTLSGEVAAWEEKRSLLYREARIKSGAPPEGSFAEFLARLPGESREGLEERRRRLRVAVDRVGSLTGGIDAYVRSSMRTMEKVLEEFFPPRRLRTYTRTGEVRGADHPPVVAESL